jgi:xylulokinase
VAIGLTGQCPTVAPIGADGQPVGPGIMYLDNRAVHEAEELRDRFGSAEMHRRTGHVPEAFYVGPRILWLRRHQPDVFARTARFLQPRDVVLRRLTGEEATDVTHAGTTLFFDLVEQEWAEDLLDALNLDPALFPRVLRPTDVAGTLRPDVAAEVGLRAGIPVTIGAADSLCAAFGAGVVDPGPISEMAGSSSCLNSAIEQPLTDERITQYQHVLPGRYMTEVGVNTAGAAADWVVRQFEYLRHSALLEDAERFRRRWRTRRRHSANPLDIAPLFVPYLGDGERNDPDRRGAFVGLSLRHDRAALAYATLEGIAFAVRSVVELLQETGCRFDELRVSGGAAKYETANQLKADVLGRTVLGLDVDATTVGAAVLAGIGAGLQTEMHNAMSALLNRAKGYYPTEWGAAVTRQRAAWYDEVTASPAIRMGALPRVATQ